MILFFNQLSIVCSSIGFQDLEKSMKQEVTKSIQTSKSSIYGQKSFIHMQTLYTGRWTWFWEGFGSWVSPQTIT